MNFNNKYYLLRHGEALSNVRQVMSSWPETFENPLTERGRQMVAESAKLLGDKHIDMIFASDILRTTQTAQIVGEALNVRLEFDTRLREIDFGVLNGKSIGDLDAAFNSESQRIASAVPGGETYAQVLERVYGFLEEIDKKYQEKNILMVSHEGPLWMLEAKVRGMTLQEGLEKIPRDHRIHKGQVKELN